MDETIPQIDDAQKAKDASRSVDAQKAKAPKSASGNSITRRTLCIGVGSTVALLGLGALRYVGSTPLVRPPGGQNENELVSKCVHCDRCIEVCPHQLLVPAKIDFGLFGMRTPYMRFSDNYPGVVDSLKYCDFCEKANNGVPLCAEVCPSTALSLGANFDSATAVLGVAKLDTNLCLAYRSGFCSFCYDACVQVRGEEASAIYFKETQGDQSTWLPAVDADKCNGCGACESVCVSAQAGSTLNAKVRAIVIAPVQS